MEVFYACKLQYRWGVPVAVELCFCASVEDFKSSTWKYHLSSLQPVENYSAEEGCKIQAGKILFETH
jgi:hypothetical protein